MSEDLKQYIVVSDLTLATQELCHATTFSVFIEATYPLREYFCSKQAAWINIEYQNIDYENHDIEK